jgi:hypothetical protein
MRILYALSALVVACGSPPKKESSIVGEGAESSPMCCCKTLPTTAEKEIVPNYAQVGRMECSSQRGDCVDDVQCNAQPAEGGGEAQPSNDGVPPPPTLEPSTSSSGIP